MNNLQKTIVFFILPAFAAAYFFSSAQSAFADAHHLYGAYCVAGWILAAWVVFLIANAFTHWIKKFND